MLFDVLDPWMSICLFCGKALVDVLHDETLQEVFSFWRMLLERLVVEVEISLDHVANDFKFRITREGHLTRQHDVQHNSH